MNSLPLYNRSSFSQASGLRGQGFGGQGRLQVNIRSQTQNQPVSTKRDTASISVAASAKLQSSAPQSAPQVADREELGSQDISSRRQRGEDLRSRLLDRARAGGIGVDAVASAMSRLDSRFDLDSSQFVEEYTKEFQTNKSPQPVDIEKPEKADRMAVMQGKLENMTQEFDLRAKESGVSQERVADLKRMLHERARAAYGQGQ